MNSNSIRKIAAKGLVAASFIRDKDLASYDEAVSYLAKCCPPKEVVIRRHNCITARHDLMVIIPVHNVEKYVEQCIDSVLNQKTKYSVDIYVVENGSTDRSLEIVRKYKETDTFHILISDLTGLSEARNCALKNITADYIMFLDSDDYLEQGALEKLMNKAIEYNADVVEGNYRVFRNDGTIIKETNTAGSRNDNDYANNISGLALMKIMRATLWENIIFPAGYLYEDTILSYAILPYCKRKYRISDVVYNYRRNESGITMSSRNSYRAIETVWLTDALWKEICSKKELDDELYFKFIEQLRLNLDRLNRLDERIQKCAFVIAQKYINNMDYKCNTKLPHKHKLFVKAIKCNQFKRAQVLARYWDKL